MFALQCNHCEKNFYYKVAKDTLSKTLSIFINTAKAKTLFSNVVSALSTSYCSAAFVYLPS